MDPIWNCILSVCCPETSEKRIRAMAKLLINAGVEEAEAQKYAPHVLDAMEPLFTALKPFIGMITRLARGADYKE